MSSAQGEAPALLSHQESIKQSNDIENRGWEKVHRVEQRVKS
jgi:hypothetical protein